MPTRAAADLSFPSLIEGYLAHLRQRGLSLSAQERARRVMPLLAGFLQARCVRRAGEATEVDLVAFAVLLSQMENRRTAAPLSPATQRMYLAAVQAFFRHLLRRGLILHDPARELPLHKVASLPRRVLTEAQARRLVSAPFPGSVLGRRDRALLELLYGTGLRRGECLRLDLTDLDLAAGTLLVRDGKGKKDRVVPLVGRALLALDEYLKESRPQLLRCAGQNALFLSLRSRRLEASRLDRLVKQHARAAGIAGRVFPHALRHTCATHLLKGRASVRHLQELLGHRSLETTVLYTRVGVEDLREVVARCHPRERAWSARARRRGRR